MIKQDKGGYVGDEARKKRNNSVSSGVKERDSELQIINSAFANNQKKREIPFILPRKLITSCQTSLA
jgi:hypothetical protein